jgi:hypothetical protein
MEPDFTPLEQAIATRFGGQVATVQDIEQFVVTETPYHSGQYKRNVLTPMERAGRIACLTPELRKQRYKYPDPIIRLQFS